MGKEAVQLAYRRSVVQLGDTDYYIEIISIEEASHAPQLA